MKYYSVLIYQKLFSLQVFKNFIKFMHKQCSTFKNVLNLRYLFFVMYLIFPKIKVMIIFKHLFVISIPSKTLATSSQYVRKLAIFALLIAWRGIALWISPMIVKQIFFLTSSSIRWIDQKHRKSSGYIEIIYFREIRSEIN